MELIITPTPEGNIREEFSRFLLRAKLEKWELLVMFGFAWGNQIYQSNWIEEQLTPNELEEKVKNAEVNGLGSIGTDDLFIDLINRDIQYTFCHEADIHLTSSHESEFIAAEKRRFLNLGWSVLERG